MFGDTSVNAFDLYPYIGGHTQGHATAGSVRTGSGRAVVVERRDAEDSH